MSDPNYTARLTFGPEGFSADWPVYKYPANREHTFIDGEPIGPSVACRCSGCGRYVAWIYLHPTAGTILLRQSKPTSDLDAFYVPAVGAPGMNPDLTESFIIPDTATDQNEGPVPAWCTHCREVRTYPVATIRSAIANNKLTTIRDKSADSR